MIKNIKFLTCLMLSVLLAFAVAFSVGKFKDRNDLAYYQNHYECVGSSFKTVGYCTGIIGYPADFLYEFTVYFSKFIFGNSGFIYFLLFFSFIVYFSILYINYKYSPLFIISILFLLSDSRFYELGNNVLRNGLSVAIVMIVFNFHIKSRLNILFKYVANIIPSFAHLSAAPLVLMNAKKMNLYIYISIFLAALVLSVYLNIFLYYFSAFLPEAILNKFYAYQLVNGEEYAEVSDGSLPIHYLFILIIGLFFVKRSTSLLFFICFNSFFIMMTSSVFFGNSEIGYRFLNYALPFASILLAYYIQESKIYFQPVIFVAIYMFAVLVLTLQFFRQYDFIFKGF